MIMMACNDKEFDNKSFFTDKYHGDPVDELIKI